jgi:hypothetical protein
VDLIPRGVRARVPLLGRPAAVPFDQLVRASGQSWWEVKLLGGRTIGEWQTAEAHRDLEMPMDFLWARSRWEELPHGKIVAARLWCPDGMIGEVEAPGPYKIFQFKKGLRGPGYERVDANVLGVLLDEDGNCDCWAWEPGTPWGLARFQDNLMAWRRHQPSTPFNLDVIGVRL